ncbi:hypothetical protein Q9S71_10930 [Microbacterium sp. KSW4-11]|uniref:DUF2238 domain-containing protein n=1 Tax=Microbacterium gawkjiense TaxID=3067309 RepID=A0ABU3GC03_9MICO|nr:hypothetical protein [Microbacterium sp. KSW4-11]MDT3317332.1 hypothetical protein [Microbacterium sp. KSW4-11]
MREDFLRQPASPAEWAADGIRLLGLISVLAAFVWWTPTDAGILALALPALLVPRLLGVLPWFDVVYGVTVSVAAWSNVLDLYRSIAWWDLVVHFVATGVIASVGYVALQRSGVLPDRPRRRTAIVLLPTIGLAISAIWEMVEWLGKTFVDSEIFVTYPDTIGDMAVGGAGALLMGLVLARIRIDRAANRAADRKDASWQR